MNPYAEIRKVPLDYNGVSSSAWSVQMDKPDKGWDEVGVVSNKYMLLSNQEVKDAADRVAQECNVNFKEDKTFFNNRVYMHSLVSDHVVGDIEKGDDVALGMQFWNSYDGSKAFGFSLMLYRLLCTNGMMSKQAFGTFRFKHSPDNEKWEEDISKVINNINNVERGAYTGIESILERFKALNETTVNTDMLGTIRHKHLQDIPVGLWGGIVDRFTNTEHYQKHTGWNLLNSATDILWHKEKPTVASYDQNAQIVDGLCNAIA